LFEKVGKEYFYQCDSFDKFPIHYIRDNVSNELSKILIDVSGRDCLFLQDKWKQLPIQSIPISQESLKLIDCLL
jgi:hypothetical protein